MHTNDSIPFASSDVGFPCAASVGFAYSGVIGFMAVYTKALDLIMAGTFFFVVSMP